MTPVDIINAYYRAFCIHNGVVINHMENQVYLKHCYGLPTIIRIVSQLL
ncbi:MAG: hypothetical protein LBL65_08485 [Campylobacteraceae bacterium]|nr:hypothetical protein [Campylobacteraceae bacterium]